MSVTNIRALKNIHPGSTIYVVASGASVDYLARDVFDDAIVVTVNEMWQHVLSTYAVMHHHERAQEAIDAGVRVVVSAIDWGGPGWGTPARMTGDYVTYETADNTRNLTPTIDRYALEADTQERLVVSPCTTSEALQFAAHLGAATIICCGIDGAALDGRWCVKGYNDGASTNPQHVRLTRDIVRATVAALRAKGVRVYALSPFVGADHEGHAYTFPETLDGRALLNALGTVNCEAVS